MLEYLLYQERQAMKSMENTKRLKSGPAILTKISDDRIKDDW